MSSAITAQRWRCRVCLAISLEHELLRELSPFTPTETLVGCPHCRQCLDGFDLVCDEPGCNQSVTSGWPTYDMDDPWAGFRQTCAKHCPSPLSRRPLCLTPPPTSTPWPR